MRSKPTWERIPASTEKLHRASLVRQTKTPCLAAVEWLIDGTFVKNVRNDCGKGTYFDKRVAKVAINQVSNKPPTKSSVKIPISACPYHCLKYPLSRKPNTLSVISGMAAPTDKASASKVFGHLRITGKIKP